MKKTLLFSLCLTLGFTSVKAQLSKGGLPLSQTNAIASSSVEVPVTFAAKPNWSSFIRTWDADPVNATKPYLVSLFTPTDLSFERSGILTYDQNGVGVWKAKLQIADAQGIGLYFDQFHLPKGVKMYVSNQNGKQVLGAYTVDNNDLNSGMFAIEPVQGGVVNIELNIEPGVNIEDIKLHVNRSAVYFRGIDYLTTYSGELETIDGFDAQLVGSSSVCNYNAICPLGNNYAVQRNAALNTICVMSVGTGVCSSTMINAASNTPQDCKQYLLIASHCEFSNATSDNAFSQFIFRFNYQHSVCNPPANTVTNTTQSITGAKFVSRSVLPVTPNGQPNAPAINGDFILLAFSANNKVPDTWGVNLAGWDNSPSTPTSYSQPKKFISFHHPAGDVKKVSSGQYMQSYSLGGSNSHWIISLDSGYAAQGSSGSGLFNGDGRYIGVASVASPGQNVPVSCFVTTKGGTDSSTAKIILYSKMSHIWDYSVDGSAANRKLKPWLDANNSGVTTLNAVKSNCTAIGGTSISTDNNLNTSVSVFPNPSNDGIVNLRYNLSTISNLSVNVYDMLGKLVYSETVKGVRNGVLPVNLSAYANGVYSVRISDGTGFADKKIVLTK